MRFCSARCTCCRARRRSRRRPGPCCGGFPMCRPAGSPCSWPARMPLDPIGRALGFDGAVFLSFLLSLPANELFLPVLLMTYTAGGTLMPAGGPFGAACAAARKRLGHPNGRVRAAVFLNALAVRRDVHDDLWGDQARQMAFGGRLSAHAVRGCRLPARACGLCAGCSVKPAFLDVPKPRRPHLFTWKAAAGAFLAGPV